MLPLLLTGLCFFGGIAPFTERGTTDFDTILTILNSEGVWETAETEKYGFRPFEKAGWKPLTEGRWLYSDFGWYWQGNAAHSKITDHYGTWKRSQDGIWRWFPGAEWYASGVDWRATKTHLGWRFASLNKLGDFEESEETRVAKPEEWIWVARENFSGPLTSSLLVVGAAGKSILEESTALSHQITTYREILRNGPDPTDYPKAQSPRLAGPTSEAKINSFVIMSLPTFWTPPPAEAKPHEIYLYRPKFFQDRDGLQRRIRIWMNPQERQEAAKKLNQTLRFP